MMIVEADYRNTMKHLRQADRSLRRMMAGYPDGIDKRRMQIEFMELRRLVRGFARINLGLSGRCRHQS